MDKLNNPYNAKLNRIKRREEIKKYTDLIKDVIIQDQEHFNNVINTSVRRFSDIK